MIDLTAFPGTPLPVRINPPPPSSPYAAAVNPPPPPNASIIDPSTTNRLAFTFAWPASSSFYVDYLWDMGTDRPCNCVEVDAVHPTFLSFATGTVGAYQVVYHVPEFYDLTLLNGAGDCIAGANVGASNPNSILDNRVALVNAPPKHRYPMVGNATNADLHGSLISGSGRLFRVQSPKLFTKVYLRAWTPDYAPIGGAGAGFPLPMPTLRARAWNDPSVTTFRSE